MCICYLCPTMAKRKSVHHILTLDCDWAPDFVLADVLDRVARKGAHATIFVTHPSPVLDGLGPAGRLELGWHPNFLPGSTHGSTPAEVADHLSALVPKALSMRTHGLTGGTALFRAFLEAAPHLRYDSSVYLPGQKHLSFSDVRFGGKARIKRLPIAWEDDCHLMEKGSLPHRLEDGETQGLCVLDFHPIHVWLNTADLKVYEKLKGLGPLQKLTESDLKPFRNRASGIGDVFDRALETLDFSLNLAGAGKAKG